MTTQAPRIDRKNLAWRLGSAAVFAGLFLTLVYNGAEDWARYGFLAILALTVVMGVREVCLMGRKLGHQPSLVAGTLVGLGLLAHFFFSATMWKTTDPLPLWLVLAAGAAIIHFGALLFQKDPVENALSSQAITWQAALFMGLGTGFILKLFLVQADLTNSGGRLVFALFLITWIGDTGAYFVGSTLGKHKLAPKVSPKKSWEGLGGNLLGNLIAAFAIQRWVCTGWTWVDAVAIALFLGFAGVLGDLAESTWKRSAAVKDSNMGGLAIPGHGGMLDRIDSLAFAAPALYIYVHFVHGLS